MDHTPSPRADPFSHRSRRRRRRLLVRADRGSGPAHPCRLERGRVALSRCLSPSRWRAPRSKASSDNRRWSGRAASLSSSSSSSARSSPYSRCSPSSWRSKSEHGMDRTLSISLSVSTIFLSWLLIHTVFALYYAHEFHAEGHAGSQRTGRRAEIPRRQHARLSRLSLFLVRGGDHGANLRRRRLLARHAPRGDAARHLVVLLQHGGDRSRRQPRRPAGAGLGRPSLLH